jgi:hypothetical protein
MRIFISRRRSCKNKMKKTISGMISPQQEEVSVPSALQEEQQQRNGCRRSPLIWR